MDFVNCNVGGERGADGMLPPLPWCGRVDTVIMNPPFGTKKTSVGIDMIFVERALEVSHSFWLCGSMWCACMLVHVHVRAFAHLRVFVRVLVRVCACVCVCVRVSEFKVQMCACACEQARREGRCV
jgi:hypothetical protein